MAEINLNNIRKHQMPSIPKEFLNDLSSRFIINVPEEERLDLTRLCFQIELAHWFYLDFYCEENPKLPKCNVREFIHIIFRHIPFLQKYKQRIDSVIENWREYKSAVPTYGAILLDQDLKNVLLVQSYYSKASWGFPKGKVNEDEKPHHCAIREVYEETGFDITDYIKNEEFLEHYFNDQLIRLYIITGIPHDAKFQPKTRKEIKAVEWFPVNNLPAGKKDEVSRTKLGPNNFFMVIPFVKQLQKWIASKLSSKIIERSTSLIPKKEPEDEIFNKQQRLFSQMTKKDFAKYIGVGDNSDNKSRNSDKFIYSAPPRMLRQRNLKQATLDEKRKLFNNFQEERIIVNSSFKKKNAQESKGDKNEMGVKSIGLEEIVLTPSLTWQNFSLDCEALVATFNINLRKTLHTQKNTA